MIIRCGMGLGNRVAAMANGLSRAEEIQFVWRVNEHLPATHEEMFPEGVPGVEFVTDAPPNFATKLDGKWCYEWDASGDRAAARVAYARIIAAMVGQPWVFPPPVAILGRFHRAPGGSPLALAQAAAAALPARDRRVFLLSDCWRESITSILKGDRIGVLQACCLPLSEDLRRTRADLLAYACDWQTLLSARTIIALDGPASALHPARAAGTEIRYV